VEVTAQAPDALNAAVPQGRIWDAVLGACFPDRGLAGIQEGHAQSLILLCREAVQPFLQQLQRPRALHGALDLFQVRLRVYTVGIGDQVFLQRQVAEAFSSSDVIELDCRVADGTG
jgi:hypothetical protein